MLHAERLTKSFGGNTVLREVSFSLRPGELTSVIGPNGAGKTTLLDALSGLISLDAGRILMGDRDVSPLAPWTRSERWIGRSFQRLKLTAALSAEENVLLQIRLERGAGMAAALTRWSRRAKETQSLERVRELLARVGLDEHRETLCGHLSFGQAKLVALCGVIASEMPIVLLDEPFTGLDPRWIEIASHCILEEAQRGRSVLFVEHNLAVVSTLAHRALALDRGRLIADAPPEEVLASDALKAAYLR